VRTPERYIDAIANSVSPEAGAEELDARGRAEELVTLALRTRRGAPVSMVAPNAVAELVDADLVRLVDERIVLTRRGRLLATDVTARLLVWRRSALALDSIEC
jgi:oxygen-independent coproporphyrinogen-3 oxidase